MNSEQRRHTLTAVTSLFLLALAANFSPTNAQDSNDTPRIKYTLAAGEELKGAAAPWTQPASFLYVADGSGDDRDEHFDIRLAGNASFDLGTERSLSGTLQWHRNTNSEEEQDQASIKLAYSHLLASSDWSHFFDPGIALVRKGVFEEGMSTQYEQSARFTLGYQPYAAWMEAAPFANHENNPEWLQSIQTLFLLPTFRAFHDEVTNAVVDADTGQRADGQASGLQTQITFGVLQSNHLPRWRVSAEARLTNTFDVSELREMAFPETSEFYTVSFEYALGSNGIDARGSFVPSIGIEYQDGFDPLRDRRASDRISLGFRLKYIPE